MKILLFWCLMIVFVCVFMVLFVLCGGDDIYVLIDFDVVVD